MNIVATHPAMLSSHSLMAVNAKVLLLNISYVSKHQQYYSSISRKVVQPAAPSQSVRSYEPLCVPHQPYPTRSADSHLVGLVAHLAVSHFQKQVSTHVYQQDVVVPSMTLVQHRMSDQLNSRTSTTEQHRSRRQEKRLSAEYVYFDVIRHISQQFTRDRRRRNSQEGANRASGSSANSWAVGSREGARSRILKVIQDPINPSSSWSRGVNAVAVLSVIIQLGILALVLARLLHEPTFNTIERVTNGCQWLDFVVNFNRSFVDLRGILVTNHTAIALHYFTSWFLPDLLSCLATSWFLRSHFSQAPLSIVVGGVALTVRLLKDKMSIQGGNKSRGHSFRGRASPRFTSVACSRYSHLFEIVQVVVAVLVVLHHLTCSWTALAQSGRRSTSKSALEEYTHGVYRVLQLFYGQRLHAKTSAENMFEACAVLVGAFVFALVYARISELVADFSWNEIAYQHKMEEVFATIEKLRLPYSMRQRIQDYYEYLHIEHGAIGSQLGRSQSI